MRIATVRLENYLGILEGTDREVIEIDFEPAKEVGRVLIFGRNGSGKSTLLRALSPFPSNGDDRALIVPGRAGRKVIGLVRPNGSLAECDVRWTKGGKVAAFLSIDGERVRETEKGNVGEYLQAVRDHLGVTPSFLDIGQIGGSISGFLDMKPTSRKNYIAQFMPEIAEWATMHKNASKRLLVTRGQLNGMQVELDRIAPREELEAARQRSSSTCAKLGEEIRQLDTQLGAAVAILGELSPIRSEILTEAGISDDGSFNPVLAGAEQQDSVASAANQKIDRLLQARPALEVFRDSSACAEKLADLKDKIARAEGAAGPATALRLSTRGALDRAISAEEASKTDLARATSSGPQLEALRARAVTQEAARGRLEKEAAELPGAPDGLTYDQVKSATDALALLEGELQNVRGQFSSPSELEEAARANFSEEAMAQAGQRAEVSARDLTARADTAKARVAAIVAQSSFHKRFDGMKCKDPNCPYEAYVGRFASADDELAEKRSEIEALESRREKMNQAVAAANSNLFACRGALALHSRIIKHAGPYRAAGVWAAIGSPAAFAALVSSKGTVAAEVLSAQRLLDSLRVKRDLSEAERILVDLRARETSLVELSSAKVRVEEALQRAREAVSQARTEHDKAASEDARIATVISGQKVAFNLLTDLSNLQEAARSAGAESERLKTIGERLEALSSRWAAAKAEQAAADSLRSQAAEALAAARGEEQASQLSLGRRDDYERRLAEITGRYSVGQAICEACHPARGAPVEFLREFLDTTRDSVNNLLDVAMNGEFRISFVLSDTEFRIPVAKGTGRTIPDVTEASEGQLALAKTVISLALVRQTLAGAGAYNVVGIDEIDGPLDREKNRDRFMTIMDSLVRDLGLEQLLVISHNDAFHTAPAGLVLLPGHALDLSEPSFNSNKIVLADFS